MFMFQMPYIPELLLKSQDFGMLARSLSDPASGGPKLGTFTEDDINAYKYTLSLPG